MNKIEFEERWGSEKQIVLISNKEYRYVSIHPFSNEDELIKKLNITKEDCTYVGSYVETDKIVSFVELEIESIYKNGSFKQGIYFRMKDKTIYSKLIATSDTIDQSYLTKWIQQMIKLNESNLNANEFKIVYGLTEQYKSIKTGK